MGVVAVLPRADMVNYITDPSPGLPVIHGAVHAYVARNQDNKQQPDY
jgi:hypothetical protein